MDWFARSAVPPILQAARADNAAALRAIPGVKVVLRDAELKRRHETSRRVAFAPASHCRIAGGRNAVR